MDRSRASARRRHEGRRVSARAERPRQAGARPRRGWAKAAGLSGHDRQDRQRLHAPRGQEPVAAARSSAAATSTRSRPAASSTGTTACSRASRSFARSTTSGIETEAPIEVAFWTNEEGSRFVPVMMGSGVFAGRSRSSTRTRRRTSPGRRSATSSSASATSVTRSPGKHPIGAYFEAHIEQGPVLEDAGQDHRRRHRRARPALVRLRRDGHGGARGPDADGAAQGRAPGRDEDHARGRGDRAPVPAVRPRHGRLRAVLPEQPQRHPRAGEVLDRPAQRRHERLDAMDREIRAFIEKTAKSRASPITIEQVSYFPPCPFEKGCVDAVERREEVRLLDDGRGLGRRPRRGVHGSPRASGDDLRPVQGRHQPQRDRDAKPEHLEAGCNVLLHAMLDRAGLAK
jgi:N-carbamoyl-L-amino-acid hydrolase